MTGGPKRNTFEMWNGAAQVATTDQFTIQGKIATNHGVTADAAVVNGGFVDVFATSESAALHVEGQAGKFVDTLMSHDPNSTRFYARLAVTGGQQVTSVKVVNNQDNPPSSATVDVRAVSVTQATYDGTTLTVAASVADPTKYPLTVDAGGTVGTLPSAAPVGFPLTAPPGTITVSSGALKATAPVTITGGPGSPTGTTAPPAGPVVGPVCDPSPCGPGGSPTGNPVARVVNVNLTAPRGLATVIDGSGSTNATTFKTVIKSGPQGATVVNDTTNKPSIVLPTWAAPTDVLPRAAASTADTIVTFTASNGTTSSSVDVKITPARDTVAVDTTGPCPVGGPAPTAAPTAKVAPVTTPVVLGDSVALDASTSTNATSYEWTSLSGANGVAGPVVTFANGTTAKPTAKLSPFDVSKYTLANLPEAAQNAVAKVQVIAVNGTTKSAPVTLDIPVKIDTVQVTATKFTAGKEYRIDGTSLTGGSLVLNPPTSVSIYNTTTGKLVGTAPVDTTGAWSFRPRAPFATTQDLARNITVVSSRGGYTTGLVAGAPN